MFFSIIAGLVLAAASIARGAPAAVEKVDPYRAQAILLFSDCHFKACLESLAPALAICAAALAQGDFDFINDAACFAGAAEKVHSKPASCEHCY